MYAFIMLAVLLSSSAVLELGGRQVKRKRYNAGRLALIATVCLGLLFLALQAFEYLDHWKTPTPISNNANTSRNPISYFVAALLLFGTAADAGGMSYRNWRKLSGAGRHIINNLSKQFPAGPGRK